MIELVKDSRLQEAVTLVESTEIKDPELAQLWDDMQVAYDRVQAYLDGFKVGAL